MPQALEWDAPARAGQDGQVQQSKHRARCCRGPRSGCLAVQARHEEATPTSTGEPLLNFGPSRNSRPQATVESGGGARTPAKRGTRLEEVYGFAGHRTPVQGGAQRGAPPRRGCPEGVGGAWPRWSRQAKGKGSQAMAASSGQGRGSGPSRRAQRALPVGWIPRRPKGP